MAEQRWVLIELNNKADGQDPQSIRSAIRHHLKGAEVFVPASETQRGSIREWVWLMDGYCFIRHQFPDNAYTVLRDTRYIVGPVGRDGRWNTVGDRDIDKFRQQIELQTDQGIGVGDTVMVMAGPYRNIKAVVQSDLPEHQSVIIRITLRSTDRLVTLPRAFLKLIEKSNSVGYRGQLQHHLNQLTNTYKVMSYGVGDWFKTLNAKHLAWDRLDRTVRLMEAVNHIDIPLKLPKTTKAVRQYKKLDRWVGDQQSIQHKMAEIRFGKPLLVIVDGDWCWEQCLRVKSLREILDQHGRVVGPVMVLLKLIGSLKARFPNGQIRITWSKDYTIRKVLWEHYRGDLGLPEVHAGWVGVQWVQDLLQHFPCKQVFSDQESKDAIYTLTALDDEQFCMVVSGDKGLLQLVGDRCIQLQPSISSREFLWDRFTVKEKLGVWSPSVALWSALVGDSINSIPSIVSNKVAARLVMEFKDLNGIVTGNLSQYGKPVINAIQSNKDQFSINLHLQNLMRVGIEEVVGIPNRVLVQQSLQAVGLNPSLLG